MNPVEDSSELLQTDLQSLPLVEVLQKPPTALLGVSDAAATAPGNIGIKQFLISLCRACSMRPRTRTLRRLCCLPPEQSLLRRSCRTRFEPVSRSFPKSPGAPAFPGCRLSHIPKHRRRPSTISKLELFRNFTPKIHEKDDGGQKRHEK